MIFRCTYYYQQSNMGWSETWWKDAADLTSLAPSVNDLAKARREILYNNVNLQGVRVAAEGPVRQSKLILPGKTQLTPGVNNFSFPSAGAITPSTENGFGDQVRAALQVQLVAGGNHIGLRYLSGIPDVMSRTEPEVTDFNNPVEWWGKFRLYRDLIVSSGWTVRVQLKTGGALPRLIQRWQLSDAAPNVLGAQIGEQIYVPGDIGSRVVVTGARSKFSGVRTPNGTWQIDAIQNAPAPATWQIVYLRGTEGLNISNLRVMGNLRRQTYGYVTPSNLVPMRVGIHQRGRPFGSPRGRRASLRYGS